MAKRSLEKFKVYKNVFDEFTLQTLFRLSSQGHFEDLLSPIMIGKESNVFLAETKEDFVIVKIYRLQTANFNQMYTYIRSDPRFMDIKNQRRLVIFRWVQREYRNLLVAREKVLVPRPIAFHNNVLVMDSIGGNAPASQLKDQLPKDLGAFAEKTYDSIKDLLNLGLIHGDLSEFNILIHNENPYFIDFSQGTSTKDPRAHEFLERDVRNITNFFNKRGAKFDAKAIYEQLKKEIIK